MAALIWIDESPLRKKLKSELSDLSLELRDLEQQIESYFNRDLPQYQAWLGNRFAEKLQEIQHLDKCVREMSKNVETTVQLSMEMEINPADMFHELSERGFYNEDSDIDSANDLDAVPQLRTKGCSTAPAKDVYRRIIRCLHPDLRGRGLSEVEKDLWVRVQRAYGNDDVCELLRLEAALQCQSPVEGIAYSTLIAQARELARRCAELRGEMLTLRHEKAWNFSRLKNVEGVAREVELELQASLKELKQKQTHFSKTLRAWECPMVAPLGPKSRRRGPKQQASLFDT